MIDATGDASIDLAAAAISRGEVIALPTDTVYGLACDPADAAAVERVYAIKRRPEDLELTLMAATTSDLEPYVRFTSDARRLVDRFWPGALSMVLAVGQVRLAIPRFGETLSCRVPGHAMARSLMQRTGPLASTSANRHGRRPAASAAEAQRGVGNAVALVLDGGPAGGEASTIIDCTTTPPRVLREGPIASGLLFAQLGHGNSEAE